MLPFTLSELATYLEVEQTKISESNTTSMLSRSIGAVIFGIASDQYGRKIPLLVDLVLLGVFTLCTGFIHNFGQLIGVRLLFGKATLLLVSKFREVNSAWVRYPVWRAVRYDNGHCA